jgi:hypothetical protein
MSAGQGLQLALPTRYRHPALNIDCRKAGISKDENRARQ